MKISRNNGNILGAWVLKLGLTKKLVQAWSENEWATGQFF